MVYLFKKINITQNDIFKGRPVCCIINCSNMSDIYLDDNIFSKI